ncbi:MAG: S8 family serine peptidase [Phycisphaerales bacterium]|nr:S8 family serine peptidase [Phycisphaerales bacterium]
MSITSKLSMLGIAGATVLTASLAAAQPTPDSIIPDKDALTFEHVPNRVFVRFIDPDATNARAAVLAGVGGQIASSSKIVPGLHCIEIDVTVEQALKTLSQRGDVLRYVEPVYVVRAFDTIPNDAYYNNLYGMPQINAPQAWDEHQGDQEFVIAVIDTGIDYNHPDLVDNIWTNPGEIAGNGIDDDGNGYVDDMHGYDFYDYNSDPMDGNGHGTHCGGTIGGVGNNGIGVAGVNWRCRLVGAQFLGSGGSGSIDGAIDAVEYCAINQFKVSNNSWGGGGFSQALFDVIQTAGDDFGHIFVAAAGNSGSNGASYPGALTCDNIICVAATDSGENLASFSQYHISEVDLGAPGVDIQSTTPGNNYSYYSGTSMATPHVAGGVALAYSIIGNATAVEVIDVILSTTRAIPALDGRCVTGGVLNVEDALEATFLGPQITMVSSVPAELDPGVSLQVRVQVDPREDDLVNDSVKLRYRANSGLWSQLDMDQEGPGNSWVASVPAMDCGDSPEFYVSCEGQVSGLVEHPSGGASNAYDWLVGELLIAHEDNGQTDGDWTVSGDALDGQWNRGVPVNCNRGDPNADNDGSGSCWLTDNSSSDSCNSDVDEGSTILTSGVIDLSGVSEPVLSYARWFSNNYGAAPNTDTLVVDYSTNGVNWSNLETVGPSGPDVGGGWVVVSWELADIIGDASQIQLRFTASDVGADTQSVVEAGVDAIMVSATECNDAGVPGDANGDGIVDVNDILAVIAAWGTTCNGCLEDLDGSGEIDVNDLLLVIANW